MRPWNASPLFIYTMIYAARITGAVPADAYSPSQNFGSASKVHSKQLLCRFPPFAALCTRFPVPTTLSQRFRFLSCFHSNSSTEKCQALFLCFICLFFVNPVLLFFRSIELSKKKGYNRKRCFFERLPVNRRLEITYEI